MVRDKATLFISRHPGDLRRFSAAVHALDKHHDPLLLVPTAKPRESDRSRP